MTFCTVISCMDGRIQLPVIEYLQIRFGVEFVDNVTEPGPAGLLSSSIEIGSKEVASIFRRVEISVQAHASKGIAIAAHHDCAGNPIPDSEQIQQIHKCVSVVSNRFPNLEIIGLWIDKDWTVQEITSS